LSSTGSVITTFSRDAEADALSAQSVLEVPSGYVASYWSSDLRLGLVFTDGDQLIIYGTDGQRNRTNIVSEWRLGESVPVSSVTPAPPSTANWYTFHLFASEFDSANGGFDAGAQITLARDDTNNALYAPSVDSALAVNHPATGSVSLSDNPVQGQSLTLTVALDDADTSNVDGLIYEWQVAFSATASEGNWTAIAGANAAQFTPTAEQLDRFLRVKVTYTDGLGYQETVFSSVSTAAVIANQAPAAVDQTLYLPRGEAYTFKAADFPFSDPDSGDTLSAISLLTLPQTGQLTFNQESFVLPVDGFTVTLADLAAGRLRFTPASGSALPLQETLGFIVVDSKRAASETSGLLSLADSNRPTSSNGEYDEIVTGTIGIRPFNFNFDDRDGDLFDAITITQLPSHGQLTLAGQVVKVSQIIKSADMYDLVLSYTPIFNGGASSFTDVLSFKVSDGKVESSLAYDLQFNVVNPDPTGNTSVSGQVMHWKGASPVPITDVAVTLGTGSTVLTDALGQFSLASAEAFAGSPVAASVTTPFASKVDAGITLTDVLATLKVYLGRELPSDYASPFNMVAADFDANGVVNLSDVLGLLKYYLGRTSAGAAVPTWAFVDAADVVSVNGQSKIMNASGGYVSKTDVHLDPVSFTDAATPVHMIGVIRGDVDGSWALAHAVL